MDPEQRLAKPRPKPVTGSPESEGRLKSRPD